MAPGDDRYSTFLSLSGDAIARLVMDDPHRVDAPEDEQVAHILRHARVAECNELFARFYGRKIADMPGLAMGDFVPSEEAGRMHGIREFIRQRYHMVYVEEEHDLGPGAWRWISASALGVVEGGCLRHFWVCLREITERKRAELDRERRGRILEAVAFSAARLLQPGPWHAQADHVVERLGRAAQVARCWIAEVVEGVDGAFRMTYRALWTIPGMELPADDPLLHEGVSLRDVGLESLGEQLRAGRPLVTQVRRLSAREQALPLRMGSKAFAAVPIFGSGTWWGFLGFGETRFEREWSPHEVEALKAAAAVLGAAIEGERADQALRESEERFQRLSAAAFEGIAITDAGAFVDGNEQLASMLGCRLNDLLGRAVQEFVAPEDRELVRTRVMEGREEPYQHLALRGDGSRFPVEVRARSLPFRGRSVRVSALRDVSARVEAERRQQALEADLRLAAEQWRQTLDALDLGIVLSDAAGRIVRLNRSALEQATGSVYSDAVGRRLDELPEPEPWRTVRQLHRQIGETRASLTAEAREPTNGRSFYFLGSPWFRDEGKPPWRVITFREVTEYTTMLEQLRRARVMEAMGSLVAGVAHEVRNPLFSISATVDALEAEIGQRPEFAEYAALLRSQVGRLTQLMRDLLDYGKPSVLRRAPTSLPEVLRRAARACAPLARERNVTIEERLAEDLPVLEIDGARVEQAFENLLANAIQHAPAGSTVRVVARREATAPPRVRCAVEDEGPGLSAENLERIFEPFFTRRKGGTGLGLSIVQRVVEAHEGSITAENTPGGGARFTVVLPVRGTREATAGA